MLVTACVSVYLVHDRGGRGFNAWLLVREGQLLQQVHIGQGILQGHVGRHGNKASLTQKPDLGEMRKERAKGRGGSSIKGSQNTQNGAEYVIQAACRQEVSTGVPRGKNCAVDCSKLKMQFG